MERVKRKDLVWAIRTIVQSQNIWNNINRFSANGEDLADILHRLEEEEEEE
jgi:hypothetical protein